MIIIYVDARCLQDPNYSNRGVGRFSKNVLKGLKAYSKEKVVLKAIIDLSFDDLLVDIKYLFDEIVIAKAQALKDCDIFLSLSPMTHSNKDFAKVFLDKNIYKVCLFYDMIPYQFPETFLPTKEARLLYKISLYYLRFYDLFLSISDDARNKLCEYVDIDKKKCKTVGASINDIFLDYKSSKHTIQRNKIIFNKKEYFINIGGACSRKNSCFALKAFAQYVNKYKSDFGFVIVDSYIPNQKLYQEISQKYRINHQLQLLSNITDEELAEAFNGAIANICPSKAEGFFLPLVEAFACGSISITSECEAQCELIENNKSIIFSLQNTKELVKLLRKIETNEYFVDLIKSKYSYLPKKFSVKEVNKRVNNYIFNNFKKVKKKNIKVKSLNKKLKIAFVTPYPPDQSGCADYSYTTLKFLCKEADVDIYTDAKNPINDVGAHDIFKISPIPYLSKKYDEVISVIGNSDFHVKIIRYNLNYGGISILHDARNFGVYLWLYGIEKVRRILSLKLNKNIFVKDIIKWINDENLIEYLFLDDNIRASKVSFIHSKETIKLLSKYKLSNIYYLPFCIYNNLSIKYKNELNVKTLRKKYGFLSKDIIISVFGLPANLKAYKEIVKAANILIKEGYINTKFCFVGKLSKTQDFYKLIDEYKISKQFVFFEDFVPKDAYDSYLCMTDIAIQLRKYKIGGLSGALLDCINAGIYTISNKYLKRLLDAPRYVEVIADEIQVKELYNILKKAIDSKKYLTNNEKEREKYVTKYNFENYVNKFLKIINKT